MLSNPRIELGLPTAVVLSGHPIAKVIALKVRDEDRFRTIVVHPTPADPTAKPSAETPPVQSADNEHGSPRGVDLADAYIGQLSGDQKQRLDHVLRPKNVVGLFPEDTKGSCPSSRP